MKYLTGVIKLIILLPEFLLSGKLMHPTKPHIALRPDHIPLFIVTLLFIILLNSVTYATEEEVKIDNTENINSTNESIDKEFKLYTGIILGTNYTANYQNDATGGFSPNISLFAEYPFLKNSSAAVEFGYWQRRWEITDRNDKAIEVTADFFNTQFILRHGFEIDPVRPYLIFGLYLDYFLSGNFKADGHEYEYTGGEYIKKVTPGTVWGIGSEYSLRNGEISFLKLDF